MKISRSIISALIIAVSVLLLSCELDSGLVGETISLKYGTGIREIMKEDPDNLVTIDDIIYFSENNSIFKMTKDMTEPELYLDKDIIHSLFGNNSLFRIQEITADSENTGVLHISVTEESGNNISYLKFDGNKLIIRN